MVYALLLLWFLAVTETVWAQTTPNPRASPAIPTFQGYPDAPPFSVVPRQDGLTFHPCTQCHQFMPPNPTPRQLMAPHPITLNHGRGRMWCLTCHHADDRDTLRTLRDEKVSFDEVFLVCGQCHFNRQKDWYFGGHGKRVADWQGERQIFLCTHCHDPHDPTIKPRQAQKPPPVRAGLEPMKATRHELGKVWERLADQANTQETTDER